MTSAHYAEHMRRIQVSLSLEIEKDWCVRTFPETGRIIGITYVIQADAIVFDEAELLLRPSQYIRILEMGN